jgi:hypothetical protein
VAPLSEVAAEVQAAAREPEEQPNLVPLSDAYHDTAEERYDPYADAGNFDPYDALNEQQGQRRR